MLAPVLSAEERQALLTVRRLVGVTSKSCSQWQEYIVQIALLDRLLRGVHQGMTRAHANLRAAEARRDTVLAWVSAWRDAKGQD